MPDPIERHSSYRCESDLVRGRAAVGIVFENAIDRHSFKFVGAQILHAAMDRGAIRSSSLRNTNGVFFLYASLRLCPPKKRDVKNDREHKKDRRDFDW